jgi:hypothetical protein
MPKEILVHTTFYSKVTVELTKDGAEFINSISKQGNAFLKNQFINPVDLRTDYEESDLFCNTLIFISEIYLKTQELGLKEPFIDGTISVDGVM